MGDLDWALWLRGLAIGFAIAAPVGPIGLLCIQRTLGGGYAAGFVSGLGAATADAAYGMVAAFGLTAISSLLLEWQVWLAAIGGIFLCYLGVRTFRAPPAQTAAAGRSGLLSNYGSTFVLTLTNPVTILAFAAIFAGLGLASGVNSYASATLLVAGVFCGSAAWWLLLSGGVSLLREAIDGRAMVWINRVAGAVILGFGVAALWQAWR